MSKIIYINIIPMKKEKKIKYEAPTLEVVFVELEQGIAAASVTVSGGNAGSPYQPQVDDWGDGGGTTFNGDL